MGEVWHPFSPRERENDERAQVNIEDIASPVSPPGGKGRRLAGSNGSLAQMFLEESQCFRP
jgi:hypothetical protein